MRSISASGISDRSSIRSETSATRCIGGKCKLSARAARRKFGPSFAVRKNWRPPPDLAGRLRYLDLRGEGPLWGPGTGRQFAGREQERLVQFRCARILLFSHRFGCL